LATTSTLVLHQFASVASMVDSDNIVKCIVKQSNKGVLMLTLMDAILIRKKL